MDPKIWGPNFWFTLHTVTLGYPNNPTLQDKRKYNDFFISVKDILPCPKCRIHYQDHLTKFPISVSLDNKDYLVKWLYDLHNKVNESLNKPNFPYEKFIEKYRKIYNPSLLDNIKKNKCDYKIFILLIFIICLCGYIFYQYQKKRKKAKLLFN